MKKIRLTESQLALITGKQNIDEGFKDSLKKAAVGGAMGLATLGGLSSCEVTGDPNGADPKVEQASQTLDYLQMNLNRLADEYGNENYHYLEQFFPTSVQDCMDMSREDADRLIDFAEYHVSHRDDEFNESKRMMKNIIRESINSVLSKKRV